jgi:hypothetical protein
MQNKSDIKQYGKQKKDSFLSSLVLKKKIKPAVAESLPTGRQGSGVVKENECLNTIDLRGKKLREKQLVRIVDIKHVVHAAAKPKVFQPARAVPAQPAVAKRRVFLPLPRLALKATAIALIVGINWASLSFVGTTTAIFHDEEGASGTLSAGSVAFSLTVTPFDTIAASLNMESGTSTSREVSVYPDGESNPFQYYASSTNFSGDEYFCDALLVSASVGGMEIFNGLLKDFITATTTELDTWEFTFTTAGDHPNSVCHFDIDFNGWQTRNSLPGYEDGGYKDTETVSSSIYSSGFRIQKVSFDQASGPTIVTGDATAHASVINIVNTNTTIIDTCCDGDDDCLPVQEPASGDDDCDDDCEDIVVVNNNDATIINNVSAVANTGGNSANGGDGTVQRRGWVEIYNQTNVPLDFSGWKICDGIACDTIPSDVASIPAHGFAVITEDETLWHEWNIPGNVVMIALSDGTIGGGLDYAADMVLIERPDNVVIDQMNWGEPSYAWLNYNSDVWNPGILVSTSTSPTGKVLAREPLGFDTNQPDDFVELELPVVDLLYPDEQCDDVWYWTYTYPIEWDAFNQNGGNEELLVDIFVIFDENDSGEIDDGDTAQAIALGTENDGEHSWTVPEGFIGTIWIQVIARGPENPMLFSGTISGDIWDPIPEEMADNYKDEYLSQQLGFKGFHAGAAPVQAPVQIQVPVIQGPPLDTNDVGNKGFFVGEETDTPPVSEDETVDETSETGNVFTDETTDEIIDTESTDEAQDPTLPHQDDTLLGDDTEEPATLPEQDHDSQVAGDDIDEATLPEEILNNEQDDETEE